MLEIIKDIINYIPRESVEDMLSVKIPVVVAIVTESPLEAKDSIFSGMVGLPGYSEESNYPTIEMKVTENKVQEVNLKKTKYVEDILRHILDTYEKDYKDGKNWKQHTTISKDDSNYMHKLIMTMHMHTNIIAVNCRMGPGNIVILPKHIYDNITPYSLTGLKAICNPLDDYKDKIFIIRKEPEQNKTSQKYYLLTDSRIPSDRELKINKLLDSELQEIREINYAIVPVYGHKETIAVINLV